VVTTDKEKKMYRSANQTTSARRRIGVLVFTGAAAGLVTFALGAGSAAASPDAPFVPRVPSLKADAVALNPQPLPPGPDWSRVALNPQPLPPGPDLSRVALNPQPLPPGPDWLRVLLPRVGF
jgi:hypothetical protein